MRDKILINQISMAEVKKKKKKKGKQFKKKEKKRKRMFRNHSCSPES